jgi:hypothetical protein
MTWQDGSRVMGPKPYMWRLQKLACTNCGLSGALPMQWQNMDSLHSITLARNNFTGMVHFGAQRLQGLSLDCNPLMTRLEPMLAWGWPLLANLSLSHCQLSGPLPPGVLR